MNILKIREALTNIQGIIESTYEHDEEGNRIEDMAGNVSGADVIAMLAENESLIDEAIEATKRIDSDNIHRCTACQSMDAQVSIPAWFWQNQGWQLCDAGLDACALAFCCEDCEDIPGVE